MPKFEKKLLSIYVFLAAALAAFFWSYSRYPGLLKKMAKGTSSVLQAWSFDILWKDTPEATHLERIGGNFLNWCMTNWKGMTFGILMGTLMLAIFRLFQQHRFRSPWLRTLFGVGLGAPMGLCANCATPVGLSLKKAGAGNETALALILTSPTLNVIALSMTFSLFPFSMAAMKVAGTLAVLALIPIFVQRSMGHADTSTDYAPAFATPPLTWPLAFRTAGKDIFKSFGVMLAIALPLMLIAGLLGAVLFELLPKDWLSSIQPTFLNILLVSIVGALAPVPMMFDVVFSAKLLEAGLPNSITMAMLFSLGIFSIYPALAIGRSFSFRLAATMFLAVVGVSTICAGLIAAIGA